eukprot:258342-Alexandrium_andersonii.AAC.1
MTVHARAASPEPEPEPEPWAARRKVRAWPAWPLQLPTWTCAQLERNHKRSQNNDTLQASKHSPRTWTWTCLLYTSDAADDM